jgi:hypothetical protein
MAASATLRSTSSCSAVAPTSLAAHRHFSYQRPTLSTSSPQPDRTVNQQVIPGTDDFARALLCAWVLAMPCSAVNAVVSALLAGRDGLAARSEPWSGAVQCDVSHPGPGHGLYLIKGPGLYLLMVRFFVWPYRRPPT